MDESSRPDILSFTSLSMLVSLKPWDLAFAMKSLSMWKMAAWLRLCASAVGKVCLNQRAYSGVTPWARRLMRSLVSSEG